MKIRGKIIQTICIYVFLFHLQNIYANEYPHLVPTIKIGEDFVVFEAEATNSPLGLWELRTSEDEHYYEGTFPPIRSTHLEFMGNDHNSGPATSPLDYTFLCPKTGTYRLAMRLYQRLEGLPDDKCNDVYIRMKGNFTSGSDYSTDVLKKDMKFFGRGEHNWGTSYYGDLNHVQHPVVYKLIEGEEYTFTMSGRAQRTNIDYILLYETSNKLIVSANKDLATENDEMFRPDEWIVKSYEATGFDKFTGIAGFSDAIADTVDDNSMLTVMDSLSWGVAKLKYTGSDGQAYFYLNTLQELAGESTFIIKVDGVEVGRVTNDEIFGTAIPDLSTQNHIVNEIPVFLKHNAVISVEFNNISNGNLIINDTIQNAKGRWLNLMVATSGDPDAIIDDTVKIIGFELINATTDNKVVGLEHNTEIDLDRYWAHNVNVRVITNPETLPDTVKCNISVSGIESHNHVDETYPYAVWGDDQGDFMDHEPKNGSYTISAVPVLKSNEAVAGESLEIQFILKSNYISNNTSSASLTISSGINDLCVYPTYIIDQVNIKSKEIIESVTLINTSGMKVKNVEPNGKEYILDCVELRSGYYFLSIKCNSGTYTRKFVKK